MMTNRDKYIRNASDEELALFLTQVMAGNGGAQIDGVFPRKGMEHNTEYFSRLLWIDWLKREVQE